MKVGSIAIEQFGKWIVGGVPFAAAKNIVSDLQNSDMTNEEKRTHAVVRLKSFGYDLAGFLVNLAIELAVAYIKEKGK